MGIRLSPGVLREKTRVGLFCDGFPLAAKDTQLSFSVSTTSLDRDTVETLYVNYSY